MKLTLRTLCGCEQTIEREILARTYQVGIRGVGANFEARTFVYKELIENGHFLFVEQPVSRERGERSRRIEAAARAILVVLSSLPFTYDEARELREALDS